MAALPLRVSRPPPAALAVAARAPHTLRPNPLGRRGPSFAPLKMQSRTREPFRSNCADNIHKPEPEPEDHENNNKAEPSGNCHLVDKLLKYIKEARAEMGIVIREAPDMFVTEKERISGYQDKLFYSHGTMVAEERTVASLVCTRARDALDLASHVMMTQMLFLGILYARVYIGSLAKCREAALSYLKD